MPVVTLFHRTLPVSELARGFFFFFWVAQPPRNRRFQRNVRKLLWGTEAKLDEIWKGVEERAVLRERTPGSLCGARGMAAVLFGIRSSFLFTCGGLPAPETRFTALWLHS